MKSTGIEKPSEPPLNPDTIVFFLDSEIMEMEVVLMVMDSIIV